MNDAFRRSLLQGVRAGSRYAIVPPQIAPFGLAGAQLGNRPGSSIEFMDHREYRPGDDLRRIDWSAYARSDRLIVKLYREEVSPHLDLIIDSSRSMDLAQTQKAAATLGLAGALATAADNAAFTHTAWLAGEGFQKVIAGSERPTAWQNIDFTFAGNVSDSFSQLPPRWRRQGVRVLISDLLWLGDPLPLLKRLAEGAASIVVVQVLAEQDVTPPQRGNIRLVDCETDQVRELFLDASAEKRYREAFNRHQDNWRLACRQVGAVMSTMVAERIIDDWDLGELVLAEVLKVV